MSTLLRSLTTYARARSGTILAPVHCVQVHTLELVAPEGQRAPEGAHEWRYPRVLWILTLMALTVVAKPGKSEPTVVNCDAGQSLNRAVARLDKRTPTTVWVKGTCTEYVLISGFEGLTVKGVQGATLAQPSGSPATDLLVTLLRIDASRSVAIDGLSIHSSGADIPIGIGKGSSDVRLRNLTIEGGLYGIIIFENSQVSIARVTARNPGYATVGTYDVSDVHIEDSLFEDLTGTMWHVGIDVGASHVTLHGTTIRNMQVGMNASGSGVIDVVDFNTYYPFGGPSDVVIESPSGSNFNGVVIGGGSSLNLGSAKLRITNAGQPWGGNTGGVLISGGSTLNAGANLVVAGSQGQGVFVTDNSHASLDGSQITGSHRGGLVVVNLSTIAVGSFTPPTEVSGNATDLFCDSKSIMSGGANIAHATSVQCPNLLAGENEPVP
jgi:Right handed beta helix region